MSGNKRIRRPQPELRGTLQESLQAAPPKAKKSLKDQTRDLQSQVHRLEVEIAATSRIVREDKMRTRDYLSPPERLAAGARSKGKSRLTYAQAREKRNRFYMQGLEFFVTGILLVGACAALYSWWKSRWPG